MGYSAKLGSFNVNTAKTATQTQAITGVGFLPKVILFWWNGTTSTSASAEENKTYNFGFGAAISSTSRFCVNAISENAQADSDALTSQYNTEFMRAYTDTGTLDGILDFSSMDADGFTYIVDDQFTQAYRIFYLALGGTDLTNYYIGTHEFPGGTSNYQIDGVGFQPDAVITASTFDNTVTGTNNGIDIGIGMGCSATEQGAIAGTVEDAQAITVTVGYGYTDFYSRGDSYHGALVSMDADGFTVNHKQGTSVYYFNFLALKGGQYHVGNFLTRNDTNNITETGVGFTPVAIFQANAGRPLSTYDTPSNGCYLGTGAATDDMTQAAISIWDGNGEATSNCWITHSASRVYINESYTTNLPEVTLSAMNSDGFVAAMTVAESPCWVTYLAIGAAPAIPRKMEYYRRLRQ